MIEFDPLEYDGLDFGRSDIYREEMIDTAEIVRVKRSASVYVGEMLSRNEWEEGRAILEHLGSRDDAHRFPLRFMYFVKHPELLGVIDNVLIDAAKLTTPAQHSQLLADLRRDTESVLFELSVFAAARSAGFGVTLFPEIPGTGKVADLLIRVNGRDIYTELSLLSQGRFWNGVDEAALASPTRTWTGAGPGLQKESNRISWKIEEELRQVAPRKPNVLIIGFNNTFPSKIARSFGFQNALEGPVTVRLPKGVLDFSNRVYLDCALEVDGTRWARTFLSPECYGESLLRDADRFALQRAFRRLPFGFP